MILITNSSNIYWHFGQQYRLYDLRSEVLTAVKMSMLVFWVVTPCGLVNGYQRFGGTYRLHLHQEPVISLCHSQSYIEVSETENSLSLLRTK
jgi:hypothetical protein